MFPRRLLFMTCLAACAGTDPVTVSSTDGPRFTVTGVVYDSLAREVGGDWAAPGVHLSVNGVPVVSDAAGRYRATGVAGGRDLPVTLASADFAPHTVHVTIDRDRSLDIGLERQAPLIVGFYPAGDSTRVAVVDLQNRKTVERWQRTRVRLSGATSETQAGIEWIWTPVDDLTWLVSLPNTAGADHFDFEVHDVAGFVSSATCRVSTGCDHLEAHGIPEP